jgi:phage-related protein
MSRLPAHIRRRRWRDYSTPAGNRPIRDFIRALTPDAAAEVLAAMAEVAEIGLAATRHLRSEIYEVRASAHNQTYRVLFALEGRQGQILLSLEAFSKKTQKTPPDKIELALSRLRDWRARGR